MAVPITAVQCLMAWIAPHGALQNSHPWLRVATPRTSSDMPTARPDRWSPRKVSARCLAALPIFRIFSFCFTSCAVIAGAAFFLGAHAHDDSDHAVCRFPDSHYLEEFQWASTQMSPFEASICQHKLCRIEVWRMPNGKKARQPYFKIFSCNPVTKSDTSYNSNIFLSFPTGLVDESSLEWSHAEHLSHVDFFVGMCRGRSWILCSGATVCGADQAVHRAVGGEEIVSDSISHSCDSLTFFWFSKKVQSSWEILKGQNFSISAFAPEQRWEQQLWSATRSRTGKKICISHRRGWIQCIWWTRPKYSETGFFYKTRPEIFACTNSFIFGLDERLSLWCLQIHRPGRTPCTCWRSNARGPEIWAMWIVWVLVRQCLYRTHYILWHNVNVC